MTTAFVSVEGVEKTYRAPGRALRALDPTTFALAAAEFVSALVPCSSANL